MGSTINLRCKNPSVPMSALGHQQTSQRARVMSGSPSIATAKADIEGSNLRLLRAKSGLMHRNKRHL